MKIQLLGGPLGGEIREWPTDEREVRFPVATIVKAYGVEIVPEIVLETALYRVIPIGESLGRVARHVGP